MKTDSQSGLCIKQIIVAVITIVLIGFCVEIITNKNGEIQLSNTNSKQEEVIQNSTNEEVQVFKIAEREIKTISRSALERSTNSIELVKKQEEQKQQEVVQDTPKYISIEEITISKDMDLTQRCGISKEDFITLMTNLRVDTSGFFEKNAEIIYDLCEKYEINEIFFCGLMAAESGWNIASNHRTSNNYISMMSGGRLIRYSSIEEGLEAAAKLLHNKYLTEGGSCYCGKTLSAVKTRFCPNSTTWVNLVYTCMKQIVK